MTKKNKKILFFFIIIFSLFSIFSIFKAAFQEKEQNSYSYYIHGKQMDESYLNTKRGEMVVVVERDDCIHCQNAEKDITKSLKKTPLNKVVINTNEYNPASLLEEHIKGFDHILKDGSIPTPTILFIHRKSINEKWSIEKYNSGDNKHAIEELFKGSF